MLTKIISIGKSQWDSLNMDYFIYEFYTLNFTILHRTNIITAILSLWLKGRFNRLVDRLFKRRCWRNTYFMARDFHMKHQIKSILYFWIIQENSTTSVWKSFLRGTRYIIFHGFIIIVNDFHCRRFSYFPETKNAQND